MNEKQIKYTNTKKIIQQMMDDITSSIPKDERPLLLESYDNFLEIEIKEHFSNYVEWLREIGIRFRGSTSDRYRFNFTMHKAVFITVDRLADQLTLTTTAKPHIERELSDIKCDKCGLISKIGNITKINAVKGVYCPRCKKKTSVKKC